MENRASPCRRAGAGGLQGVRELLGGSGPYLQPPAGWKGRLPVNIPLFFRTRVCRCMCSCPRLTGGSAHLRAGSLVGYFQARRLGEEA